MKKIAIVAAVSLVGGFAAARWLPLTESRDVAPAATPDTAPATAPGREPTLAARVAELERMIGEERAARQVLQEELFYLTGEIERLQASAPSAPDTASVAKATVVAEGPRQRFAARDRRESRIAALIDAGLSEDRAEWIVQRESRFRMAMLEARHEVQRSEGAVQNYQELWQREQEAFRRDLGQEDYERYLEATGRPTSIVVTSVLDTSPAQRVGLRPGDRIVAYDNMRIYNMADLNRATLDGAAGETVVVQIERDGMPMQVALPRGPVGITGGGYGNRE